MDDEVEVLPDTMVSGNVFIKALFCVSVEHLPIDIANEASVLDVVVCIGFRVSQLSKSVNDDTEDNVQQNCDHDQEEGQVINCSEIKALDILNDSSLSGQVFSNSTTTSQPIINSAEEAVHHGHADAVSLSVEKASINIIIVICVKHENEADGTVNVNDDDTQHSSHHQLVTIQRH